MLRILAKREGLSVISTVTNKGTMRWRIYSGAMNAKILTAFLERLKRTQHRKIFLILDNLRVHHSKVVKQWLASHAEQIEICYLPSDSPELNPDELLNADLKQRVTPAAPARTRSGLTQSACALCAAFKNSHNAPETTSIKKMSAMRPEPCCYGPDQ
jgi:transposase